MSTSPALPQGGIWNANNPAQPRHSDDSERVRSGTGLAADANTITDSHAFGGMERWLGAQLHDYIDSPADCDRDADTDTVADSHAFGGMEFRLGA